MKTASILGGSSGLLLLPLALSCSTPFPTIPNQKSIVAVPSAGPNGLYQPTADGGLLGGSLATPFPLSVHTPMHFTFDITALDEHGNVDTSFNGFVRASIQPGNVYSITVPDGGVAEGRSVQLRNGVALGVTINAVQAYGEARIWFDDVGYTPADPLGAKPPACSNGIDDNGNGLVDFPADPGCFAPTDDTEGLGSYATAQSPPIFISLPRIQDVRGYDPRAAALGTATAFPNDQVVIDTGYRPGQVAQPFSVVVTNLGAQGLFVQDLQEDLGLNPPGYAGIYAFTFSPPLNVHICDKLLYLSGVAADYYGYTELNYPTWQVQPWDPTQGACPVPVVPPALTAATIVSSTGLFQFESELIRVGLDGAGTTIRIPDNFGPSHPAKNTDGTFALTANATNCDFNGDGKIEYTGGDEQTCANACTGANNCSEYSTYASQQNFTLIVKNGSTVTSILANGAASVDFNPLALRGTQLGSITGNLMYFSGGTQWTVVARCADDIVVSPNGTPVPGNRACIALGSGGDNNSGS